MSGGEQAARQRDGKQQRMLAAVAGWERALQGRSAAARRLPPRACPPAALPLTHHFPLQLLVSHGLGQVEIVHLLGLWQGVHDGCAMEPSAQPARPNWPSSPAATPTAHHRRCNAIPVTAQRTSTAAAAAAAVGGMNGFTGGAVIVGNFARPAATVPPRP